MKEFFILFFISFAISILPQTDSTAIETDELIEDLLEGSEEETDNSEFYDLIESKLENPININTATLSELQGIPFLDLTSANIIIEHRNKYGYFFSINELYMIKSLPEQTITKIIPFIFVKENNNSIADFPSNKNFFSNTIIDLRSRVVNDLQKREGFKNGRYLGTGYKSYNRIKIKYSSNFQIGFLTEKDAGEKNLNEFSSFHLAVKNINFLQTFVAGDYLLEFGQGLSLWSPYGFAKSSDAVFPVKKKGRGIKAYTSADENQFFRGSAASFRIDNFIISSFYSKNNLDANIEPFTNVITSTPIDGYHRTEGEIGRRKKTFETMLGGNLEFISDNFSGGLLYYKSTFNNPFQPSNLYDISGKNFNYFSLYFDLVTSSLNLFGEASYNGKSTASIAGVQISLSRDFSFITSIRNYPRNFINLHGFGFGERAGATQNEIGFYSGFKLRTDFGIFNFYYDQFKFPFSTFNSTLPVNGNEILIDYYNKPLKNIEIKIRYKNENKEMQSEQNGAAELIIINRVKQNFRTEMIYNFSKNFRLKSRFDFNKFHLNKINSNEDGYLIFQDIRLIPAKNITIYTRIIFFKTDSFNSAVYEFENDLTGIFSNYAMFGEGLRWYFILRYKLTNSINASFKYAETYKPKEKSLGSGNARIDGNTDNRISFQLDIKL